jgi:hypothetical protein
MGANWIATSALVLWPVFALVLYRVCAVGTATIATILSGYLLLPVGTSIKFEGIPAFDKHSLPGLVTLVGCIIATGRVPGIIRGFRFSDMVITVLLLSPFVTAEYNMDQLSIGGTILPGSSHYDALSSVVAQLMFVLPFFVGRSVLRSADDTRYLLKALVIAGLCYSPFMLFEVRMSPQLHTWVYGYFPHSFGQQFREGGFRPVVFLGHGLLVAFFITIVMIAASAFWRTGIHVFRLPSLVPTAYLGVILVLCKSMAALAYSAALVPLVRFAKPSFQLRVGCVLALVSLLYPTLRATGQFPTASLVEMAIIYDAERSKSLQFRFGHEEKLLERAMERPFFGWGRFGRSRVYDEESGRDVSVTDGRWIITMGQFGLIGFLAEFGLLALTILRAAAVSGRAETDSDRVFLAALGLIVGISMVDQLPNSSLSPLTWLMAGALLGRAERLATIENVRNGSRVFQQPFRSV